MITRSQNDSFKMKNASEIQKSSKRKKPTDPTEAKNAVKYAKSSALDNRTKPSAETTCNNIASENQTKESVQKVDADKEYHFPIIFTNHNKDMVTRCWLHRIKLATLEYENSDRNYVVEQSAKNLQTEINELDTYLSDLPQILKTINQTVVSVNKNIQSIAKFKNDIENEYFPMHNVLQQKIKNIDDLDVEVQKMISDGSKNEKNFHQKLEFNNRQLTKVNKKFDFVSAKCDNIDLRISNLNDRKSELILKLNQLQESVIGLPEQIELEQREKEENFETLRLLEENIGQTKKRIKDNAENLQKIQQEKIALEVQQKNSSAALVEKIEINKKLNNETNEVATKTKEFEKQCLRLKQANENLWGKEEQERLSFEFENERLPIATIAQSMTDEVTKIQNKIDQRQCQYNELKRLHAQILKKEQHCNTVESNMTALTTKISKKCDNISVMKQKINEMQIRLSKKGEMVLNLARRSKTVPVSPAKDLDDHHDDFTSNATSLSLKDIQMFEVEDTNSEAIY